MQTRRTMPAAVTLGLLFAATGGAARAAVDFTQTNLVSDGFVPAEQTDPNLINPWGVSSSPTGPLWISDNNSGLASIYALSGGSVTINAIPPVTIATPPGQTPGTATPTGQAFVGGAGFNVSSGGKTGAAVFVFATEDGTISGWSPGVDQILAVGPGGGQLQPRNRRGL